VTFDGTWHHVDRAGINPLPVRRPIPLWMGADSEPGIRRAARLADGFFAHFAPNDEGAAQAAAYWGWVKGAGRDPKDVGLECRMGTKLTDDELSRAAERYRAMGATDLELNTMRAGFTSPDEHLAAYRRFMERVRA
jgi:alkanesulfonate monooxygenase SsuD/methylene tetrahydromethanopterin reductase-like flavin-dependent oxidoreductase (luciferase family)